MKTSSNHVLYLSYDGLTDPLGQSQILPYLAGLTALGYIITIISFEKKDRLKTSYQKIRQYCIENNLLWEPLIYHKSPPVLSTLYDLIALRRKTRKLCHAGNFSIVHCRSYITALIGLRLKNKYGVRFIFDMRGFWADERVEGGMWNLQNPFYKVIYKYFKKKEMEFLEKADHIISLTENAKIEIQSWNLKIGPIAVIPTCVDLELFDPVKISEDSKVNLRKKLGIREDDFVLLYLGSLGTWYMMEEMLVFFERLKLEKPTAKFLVVSQDQFALSNVRLRESIIVTTANRQEVPLFISLASASIMFIKPTFSKKASSATKLAEILAMNIPIFVNEGWGDLESIFREIPQFIVHLDQLKDINFEQLEISKSELLRDLAQRYFNLQDGINKYSKVYQNMIQT